MEKQITLPLTDECVKGLHAGETVYLNGTLYSARDAAHLRMIQSLEQGEPLPIEVAGQVIYYLGPTPARPGRAVGAAGPTSSYRMDKSTPALLSLGLKGMIGKGKRSAAVVESMKENTAVYFAAVGGAAALISQRIRSCRPVAYEDLGAEAIYQLEVQNFPVTVAIDCYGEDLYERGPADYLAGQT